jgi:hypothetical protein
MVLAQENRPGTILNPLGVGFSTTRRVNSREIISAQASARTPPLP